MNEEKINEIANELAKQISEEFEDEKKLVISDITAEQEGNETNLLFSLLTYKKLKRILKENSDFSSLDLNKLKKEILEEKLGAILMFKQFKHNSIKLKYFKFNTFYGGGDG